MGLKCSVFGHDYADYDVERDRADHGAEVVTTVRTTEICRRCSDARVVSENTEIAAASATTTASDDARAEDASGSASVPAAGMENRAEGARTVADDRDGRVGENGSVGPTTAHATSRSLAESELRCRACAFSEPMLGSPLRAGDSCPECSRGYLARRTRKE